MPIFPVIQRRGPRSCHLLPYREGRGSAESWRSGGFPGGGCHRSRIWGQFPSRLFFLAPLLLLWRGRPLTNCAGCPPILSPAGTRGEEGRCLLRQSPSLSPRCLPFPQRKSPKTPCPEDGSAFCFCLCPSPVGTPRRGNVLGAVRDHKPAPRGTRTQHLCLSLCCPKSGLALVVPASWGKRGQAVRLGAPLPAPDMLRSGWEPPHASLGAAVVNLCSSLDN